MFPMLMFLTSDPGASSWLKFKYLDFVNVTNATETEDLWLNSLTKGIKTPSL